MAWWRLCGIHIITLWASALASVWWWVGRGRFQWHGGGGGHPIHHTYSIGIGIGFELKKFARYKHLVLNAR